MALCPVWKVGSLVTEQILYRHYDGDTLLYVGITDNFWARTATHRLNAEWWPRVNCSTTQSFPDRASVLVAEADAIRKERPLFNKAGHPRSLPPLDARRVLITGSREFTDEAMVSAALAPYLGADTIIVHGCARGADQLAHRYAMAHRIQGMFVEPHPAKWRELGRRAGHIRIQEMVDAGAVVCLAFLKEGAGNVGTRNCVGRAAKAGIPVVEHWER